MRRRVVILGAAGRDFHNFNVRFRDSAEDHVVAFTATQIPGIAGRRYPTELAGPLYPEGIPIEPENHLEDLLRRQAVDLAVFSYSDVSHNYVMDAASRVVASGADFLLLSADSTMLESRVPVISVCAVRTGCGKSPVARRLVEILTELDRKVVVVRHPMPYGNLVKQRVQRFARTTDLDHFDCTIEEREEYEAHLERGTVVYAGVDYEAILRQAEQEADVILWDGGNNDTPFFRSDLEIVVADPLRPGHELLYYPGEVNLLRAHVVLINKVNSAREEDIETVRRNVREHNPRARVIEASSRIRVDRPQALAGARVLVIEDGPTLTHGGMAFGAGAVAARENGAAELIDPRPYVVGGLREVFARFRQLDSVLPAMGYSNRQLEELAATIRNTPCDAVLVATPVALEKLIPIHKPVVRARYDIIERDGLFLEEVLEEFVTRHPLVRPALAGD
jgi:predicted GTPase